MKTATRCGGETTAARQGVTGHNVRYVLGVSMLGVIVAFVAIAIVMGGLLPGHNRKNDEADGPDYQATFFSHSRLFSPVALKCGVI